MTRERAEHLKGCNDELWSFHESLDSHPAMTENLRRRLLEARCSLSLLKDPDRAIVYSLVDAAESYETPEPIAALIIEWFADRGLLPEPVESDV